MVSDERLPVRAAVATLPPIDEDRGTPLTIGPEAMDGQRIPASAREHNVRLRSEDAVHVEHHVGLVAAGSPGRHLAGILDILEGHSHKLAGQPVPDVKPGLDVA